MVLFSLPSDTTALRRARSGYALDEHRWLRDAIAARNPAAVEEALDLMSGPKTSVRLQTWPSVEHPKGLSLGWLAWAAWRESHHANGVPLLETSCSSGVVEVLVKHGYFDWNALRSFSHRRWRSHPSFQAVETACLDRLAKLPKGHTLVMKTRANVASGPYPPSHEKDWGEDLDPSWLDIAVHANRADVVKRWVEQGGPVLGVGNSYRSPWHMAWKNALRAGVSAEKKAPSFDNGPLHLPIPRLLEHAVLGGEPLRVSSHASTPTLVRDEVLSLIGLISESLKNAELDHAPTRLALIDTVHRAFNRIPFNLGQESNDHLRLKNPDDPWVREMLNALERSALHKALTETQSTVHDVPVLQVPTHVHRRRL